MTLRPFLGAAVGTALAVAPAPALAGDEKTWDTASSIGSYGLIAVAFGLPLIKGDENGALQAGGSVVAAELVTLGLKETFPRLRPDGSDRRSGRVPGRGVRAALPT